MNPKKRRDCLDREGREGEDVMTNEHFFFARPGTGKEREKVNELGRTSKRARMTRPPPLPYPVLDGY